MSSEHTSIYGDDVCTVSLWRSALVISWRLAPTGPSVTAMAAAVLAAARQWKQRVVLCALISPAARVPDSAARAHVERALAQIEGHLAASVNVVLGTGFQAAAIRAVVTGLLLVTRRHHPSVVVGTPRGAAEFVSTHWPAADAPAPSVRTLEDMLETLAPG